MGAKIKGCFGPSRASLLQSEGYQGFGGGEGPEAVQGFKREANDLDECGGEALEGFSIVKAGFQGFGGDGDDDGGWG